MPRNEKTNEEALQKKGRKENKVRGIEGKFQNKVILPKNIKRGGRMSELHRIHEERRTNINPRPRSNNG